MPGKRHSTRTEAFDQAAVDPSYYLRERYRSASGRRSPALRLYYGMKPLLPRSLQIGLRRAYGRLQARRRFPAWPIEPLLVEHQQAEFRSRLRDASASHLPFVNFWPSRRRFAFVITHDVEGPAGIERIRPLLEVEQRHGFVSSWNFVAEDYPIEPSILEELRAAGCEIGLHGIHHDGKLFASRRRFEAALPDIQRQLAEWKAVGFRSPATHRNADWMPELGCLYDSSFPDTDPFEPQAGGCCSILPFFIDDLVELPITLVQDHTLWEILRQESIDLWVEKSDWIIRHHGLVNLLVHPDYVTSPERLALYERFLRVMKDQLAGWHALPCEVAGWWRARSATRIDGGALGSRALAPKGSWEATVAWAREDASGGIQFEV
jgi:peptidoglycan/xylan/chitin deacetylase (PgdA/CDA1 family)